MSAAVSSAQMPLAGPVSMRVSAVPAGTARQPVRCTRPRRIVSGAAKKKTPSTASASPRPRDAAGRRSASAAAPHTAGQNRYIKVVDSPIKVERRIIR